MDTGAYGSYPRRRTFRKRLGAGSALLSLLKGRRRKRVNPVNQYTYKKSRVGRLTMTGYASPVCTSYALLTLPAGNTAYNISVPGGTTAQYWNLSDILLRSPEFVSRQTQFSYYMIKGMSVSFTRRWMDPISYGVDGTSEGFLAVEYGTGLSGLYVNFYPNLITTIVGQPVQDADSGWVVSPFIHGKQTHYQPFPRNFTTGTNSNGLGVWNACSQVANIQGELAVYNLIGAEPSDQGDIAIFDMIVNCYVSFCNNTGS